MNPSAILVRMKTTPQSNETSLKLPEPPVHQPNQVTKAKVGIEAKVQTLKVKAKAETGPKADEAKLQKAIGPIPLRVKKETAKAKERKEKAKVLTQKQKQKPTLKVKLSPKETLAGLL